MFRASKALSCELGYSEEELETIIIRLNNEAMTDLQTGNLKRVQQSLTEANTMLDKFERAVPVKQKLTAFTLNGWACYQHQKKQNTEALRLIDEAIKLQEESVQDNLSLARSYLNKCVILSQMNRYRLKLRRHDQALKLAHSAISRLELEKKGVGANRKRRQQLSELFVISFYNIAAEFEFLQNDESATGAYRKGYQICRELLGERHRLSQLMRKNLKSIKNDSRMPTLSELNESRRKRIKTIEVQLYTGERTAKKSVRKSDARAQFSRSKDNTITQSRLMEKPENYFYLKNFKERVSKLENRNNAQENDHSKNTNHKLQKIYMPESHRKNKLRSRLTRKTIKTQNSANSRKLQEQSSQTRKDSWSRRLSNFMVQSQIHHTASNLKESPKAVELSPPPLPQKSVELPSIVQNKIEPIAEKNKECQLI